MTAQSHSEDLRLAHVLADKADAIALRSFGQADLAVETKADGTPVTAADRAVEDVLRQTLRSARPRDAIHAEEGDDTGWGPRRWVIDPIDGTENFIRGIPVWASLIALMVDGKPVASVVSAPALNRRWWASRGAGAFAGKSLTQGKAIRVSAVDRLSDAHLAYCDIAPWVESDHGQEFVDLLRMCARSRGFGDFWSFMLVAEGAADVAAEPRLALHDIAAPSLIVTEAGGRFTNLDGVDGPAGPAAIASNGVLHDALLDQLSGVEYTGDLGGELA